MSSCQSWQAPYSFQGANQGSTPGETCASIVAGQPGTWSVNGLTCTLAQTYDGTNYTYTYAIDHQCDAADSSAPANSVTCGAACTVTVVHELSLPPLQLDAAGGALIASAVLAIWAVGYAFRMLIRTLNTDGNPTSNES